MWLLLLGLASAVVGAALAAQPTINAELNRYVGSPLWAGLVSITISWVLIGGLGLTGIWGKPQFSRVLEAPPWVILGGVIGAFFVVSSMWLAPRIGAAAFFSWFIAGQVTFALVLDHFGLMGLPENAITWPRLAGAVMVIGGALLVKYG